ncbi:MAG: TIGR03960 family B12-binding radical SAM protein [Pseudomonadota bacterium]
MNNKIINEIFPFVQRASRYIGKEVCAVNKDPESVRIRVALAFPDLYEIGMSYVGLQILYHILNSKELVSAERVFVPAEDMEARLREKGVPLFSLESRTPVSSFDIVGFSLLYELNYTGVLTILDLSGIPFYSCERNNAHPFVIAGGPCSFNPEPIADFFDAMVAGDGEEVLPSMVDACLKWKESGADRGELLREWASIKGVYVPSYFVPERDKQGVQTLRPLKHGYTVITKSVISDINKTLFPDHPIVPFGGTVHERLCIEIARGCTQGCRFCQAGMIYRPVRERSPENVLAIAHRALAATGYGEVSLLSLSSGDYGSILPLLEALMGRCCPDRIAISLPSLRVKTLTPDLMEQIKKVRKTGFTLAVEAGSQRLRSVINKKYREEDLIAAVSNAFRLGWNLIKLYFMIGLPTETPFDRQEIVALVKRLSREMKINRMRGTFNVSVSTFIPKAHTAFQWSPQIDLKESDSIIQWLRKELENRNVRVSWHNPRMSVIEGLFARGDRCLSGLLVNAYKFGCRLDGWGDRFRYDLWQKALDASGIDIDWYSARERSLDEPLPWDHIDTGVTKEYLKKEWSNALREKITADCRTSLCTGCGVCDHISLLPVTFKKDKLDKGLFPQPPVFEPETYQTIRLAYTKLDQTRYLSQLELSQVFMRAFRRGGIRIKHSKGFHPIPKISFREALPVGIESMEEQLVVSVDAAILKEELVVRLNTELPEGIAVFKPVEIKAGSDSWANGQVSYSITLNESEFSRTTLDKFLANESFFITKQKGNGKVERIDLSPAISAITLTAPDTLVVRMSPTPLNIIRPRDILVGIFNLSENDVAQARIIKYFL